ncbi:hypothetical protein EST38_g6963 [Candolleomyces aberdarensis]|uniref:F-box domain-containing protein n=1 Tax=Candolleomyces aberdarensis TaxID=2316362 RepID=A0A4V1Q3K4_9AGAR|nr:hypothetical protein EST38_g6963 [Candolleomyces aberdarensis]
MTSIVNALPQETLDEIVDLTAVLLAPPCYSPQILSTLIATSRYFQHRARTHLYRRINVAYRAIHDNSRLERVVDVFQTKRELASYVKELTIRYHLKDVTLEKAGTFDNIQDVSTHVRKGQALLTDLFGMLGRLEVVDIFHYPMAFKGYSLANVLWGEFEKPLVIALIGMLVGRSANTLNTLKVTGIQNFPLSVLFALHSLENLVFGPTGTVDDGETPVPDIVPWKLKSLFATCSSRFLRAHPSLVSTTYSQMTHLRLVFDQARSFVNGWDAINAASETLVALVIEHHADYRFPLLNAGEAKATSLKAFPHLRLLALTVFPLFSQWSSSDDIVAAAPTFLAKWLRECKFPQLQILDIVAYLPLPLSQYGAFVSDGIIKNEERWTNLAEAMASTEFLPQLAFVGLLVDADFVGVFAGDDDDDDELYEMQDRVEVLITQEIEDVFKNVMARDGVTLGRTGMVKSEPQYRDIMKGFGK